MNNPPDVRSKKPIFAAGAIPNNHQGPYVPTVAELLQGARDAAKAQFTQSEEELKTIDERAKKVFQNWGKK